jgi:hypothetical protein
MLDKLPDEINSIILSFLVPKSPKCVVELDNYKNLSLLNKEYNNNVIKLQHIYKTLKCNVDTFKLNHKHLFEIVKYEILHKIETILPTNTNEGCLICGVYLPNWWPKIYSVENDIYPLNQNEIDIWDKKTFGMIGEGVCGYCNKNGIICRICMNGFIVKTLEKLPDKWLQKNMTRCDCCFNFKTCKWCNKNIHPLQHLNKESSLSEYCNLECYESDRDYLFFALINIY